MLVQLDPHEIYAEQAHRRPRCCESQEWIGDDAEARQPVEAEAVVGQPDGETSPDAAGPPGSELCRTEGTRHCRGIAARHSPPASV
jgi:hypothetical protein